MNMRMLELFSGTGRLARAFGELGWEAVTLDSSERCGVDICCDILEWDYSEMEQFDHIQMSPPCTEVSQAKTRGTRDVDSATRICLATHRGTGSAETQWHLVDGKPRVWKAGVA